MPNETFYVRVLIYVRILRMYTYSCSLFSILGKQYKKKMDTYKRSQQKNLDIFESVKRGDISS